MFPDPSVLQLGRPDPATLVLDRWLAVPAVPPTEAIMRTFTLVDQDNRETPTNHFLTVPYPTPKIDGKPIQGLAGVCYYYEGVLPFARDLEASDDYIAVSFAQFGALPSRSSADYIVAVDHVRDQRTGLQPQPLAFTINPW